MLRSNMTFEELKLWEVLKKKPFGFKFRRQHPFGIFILDFYCHSKKLSIEIDGDSHDFEEQKAYDIERTKFINDLGVTEIRFTNDEIRNDIQNVEVRISNILKSEFI
ncbi:UNVERIFIED_CONTAM: hypothetical protein GTU68_038510 [Idotea baltica]|nr:hypothetical protein [Idotea baltica]